MPQLWRRQARCAQRGRVAPGRSQPRRGGELLPSLFLDTPDRGVQLGYGAALPRRGDARQGRATSIGSGTASHLSGDGAFDHHGT